MAEDSLQAEADRLLRQTGVPALGIALWAGGTCHAAVAGVRRADAPDPVTRDDLWHVGSLTKAMTATLAARAVDAGQIDWSSRAGEVLGLDLSGPAASITLEQLLSHRSGLPANVGTFRTLGFLALGQRGLTQQRRTYARAVLTGRLEHEPGSALLYSNAGYVVAGAMLEAVAGQTWEALLQTGLAAPFGLASLGTGPPVGQDQPLGHRPGRGGHAPVAPGWKADNPPVLGPAGRAHLTICDLARFAGLHAARPGALLNPESWANLHRARDGGYALGWGLTETGALAHNGSNTIWFARMVAFPETGRAAVAVSNSGALDILSDAFGTLLTEDIFERLP